MKRISKFLSLLLCLNVIVSLLPTWNVQAGAPVPPQPNPWFSQIQGHISGGKAGDEVDFFCRGVLAGQSFVVDIGDPFWNLQPTNVYGKDVYSVPEVPGCEDNDLIKVQVNGVDAVMNPEVRWSGDHKWYTVTIGVVFDTTIDWSQSQPLVSIPALNVDSTLRAFLNDSPAKWEKFIQKPADETLPADAKSVDYTDNQGRTYLYSSKDASVCSNGPSYQVMLGDDGTVHVSMINVTGQDVWVSLRLGQESNPFGQMTGVESGFETQTSTLWGGVLVKVGDALCSELAWDFRASPAPRILSVHEEGTQSRILTFEGFNFIPMEFDPKNIFVAFLAKDFSSMKTYNFSELTDVGGTSWKWQNIYMTLPQDLKGGTYWVMVSAAGKSSNYVLMSIPEPLPAVDPTPIPTPLHMYYLPMIAR